MPLFFSDMGPFLFVIEKELSNTTVTLLHSTFFNLAMFTARSAIKFQEANRVCVQRNNDPSPHQSLFSFRAGTEEVGFCVELF
jgi:hypothetical protein